MTNQNNTLLRRIVIEYWLEKEPTNYNAVVGKLDDCGKAETFERLARNYCPKGVQVVVK